MLINKKLNVFAIFLFDNCAMGARLCYGTVGFMLALSTYLTGFRQITLAHTIQSIVKSGDLVAEDMRRRSNKFFKFLIFSLCFYYACYVVVVSLVREGQYIKYIMNSDYIVNAVFIFAGLILYSYTIMMLREAIAQCATFQFEPKGSYVVLGIFVFILSLQFIYVLCGEFFDSIIIFITLAHFMSYLVITVAVFWMLVTTGNGLHLVSHRLNNGQMQYEGYDNKKKHLFTFIVPEVDEDGKKIVSMRTDSAISGFSGDDENSKLE